MPGFLFQEKRKSKKSVDDVVAVVSFFFVGPIGSNKIRFD